MSKLHIKSGDTVYVNAGENKGQTGKVLKVLVEKQRAIVEGVNMVSKSQKPSAKNPQGGIVKMEAPIHISNLNVVDPKTGKATRVGRRRNENGKLVEKIENNIRGTEVKEDTRAEYEYDDNGNLIWESYKSGSWGYEITYEYDEKNGLIREIEKNKDKDEIYVYENEYILINE